MREIKVFSFDGSPILAEDKKATDKMLTLSMAEAEAKYGRANAENVKDIQEHMQKACKEAIEKYPVSKVYPFNNDDDIKAVIKELGCVTLVVEEGNIVGYI